MTDAFDVAHSNAQPDDARTAVIDDPTGLPEIWAQNLKGPYKDQIAASIITLDERRVRVSDEGVFPVPLGNARILESYGPRFGEAVLVDGTWKVTRASMCQDITLIGISCK